MKITIISMVKHSFCLESKRVVKKLTEQHTSSIELHVSLAGFLLARSMRCKYANNLPLFFLDIFSDITALFFSKSR